MGRGSVRVSESGLFPACRGSLGPAVQRNLGATAFTFCTLRSLLGSGVCSAWPEAEGEGPAALRGQRLSVSTHQASPWCSPSQTALLRRQDRYQRSTVPPNALQDAQSLFVTEVMCFFYTSSLSTKWFFSSATSPFKNFSGIFKTVSERDNYIFIIAVKIVNRIKCSFPSLKHGQKCQQGSIYDKTQIWQNLFHRLKNKE